MLRTVERMSVNGSAQVESERRTDPKAFVSILRPQNCIIGGLTVISGISLAYRAANDPAPLSQYCALFILGYIIYFLVAGAGNIVNDIFDIEIDRINRPHRALPSGRMTVTQAWVYAGLLSISAVIVAFVIGPWAGLIVIFFELVGYVYAAKGKTLGIAGNFMVAFSFAFGIIFGSFIYGEHVGNIVIPVPAWLFFLTAFMILQARETIKGAEDVEGDELRDVRTIARVYGYRVSASVAAILNLVGVMSYSLVWLWGYANWDLWMLLVLGVAVVAAAGVVPLLGPDDRKKLLVGSTLDKIGALIGLVAFVVVPLYV